MSCGNVGETVTRVNCRRHSELGFKGCSSGEQGRGRHSREKEQLARLQKPLIC